MTLVVTGYDSKKQLKESVGKALDFMETSVFGPEYPDTGTGTIVVANRPHLTGRGREFFAEVTLENHVIRKVK